MCRTGAKVPRGKRSGRRRACSSLLDVVDREGLAFKESRLEKALDYQELRFLVDEGTVELFVSEGQRVHSTTTRTAAKILIVTAAD